MLRSKVRNLWAIESHRSVFTKVLRVFALVGLLWIISYPYAGQDVFTSENALRGDYLVSQFKTSPRIMKIFNSFKDSIESLEGLDEVKRYVTD